MRSTGGASLACLRETSGIADCFLLYQRGSTPTAEKALSPESQVPGDRIHYSSAEELPARLGYPYLTPRGIVSGCPHYALIDFAHSHSYTRYVSIEQDVDFTGDTLRWRPVITLRELQARFRPNTLFHPIKGASTYDGNRIIVARQDRRSKAVSALEHLPPTS